MAKVDDVIFCLRAVNNPEQGVSANTILSAISPAFVPGSFSFSVIIILLDLDYETDHTFSAEFVAPDGEKVVQVGEQSVPPIPKISNIPNEYRGINISMDWNNVVIKTSGVYRFNFLYDNKEIYNKEIFVKGKNE